MTAFQYFMQTVAETLQALALKFDKAGGSIAENAEFESNGFLRFDSDARAYNDLFLPLSSAKVPAVNTPTWSPLTTNTSAYTFDVGDYADLQAQELLHDYAEGTDIEVHVHLITNGSDVSDRHVKFEMYFAHACSNGSLVEQTLTPVADLTIPANTPDLTHMYYTIKHVDGSSFKIGDVVNLRVKRITADGTAPSNDPFVEMVGIHYIIDTLGSREMSTK